MGWFSLSRHRAWELIGPGEKGYQRFSAKIINHVPWQTPLTMPPDLKLMWAGRSTGGITEIANN